MAARRFWLAMRGNLAHRRGGGRLVGGGQWTDHAGHRRPSFRRGRVRCCFRRTPGTTTTWKNWTEAVKDATGVKGKALFMPLRLALTGQEHGPELATLLPLIGPNAPRRVLSGEAACTDSRLETGPRRCATRNRASCESVWRRHNVS